MNRNSAVLILLAFLGVALTAFLLTRSWHNLDMGAALDIPTLLLGGILAVPVVLPLLLSQRRGLSDLRRKSIEATTKMDTFRECLGTSPDGFFCWTLAGEESQVCSRRLAVLLSLPQGIDSTFEDVLSRFMHAEARTLHMAVEHLRSTGEGFEVELPVAEGTRRIRISGIRAVTLEHDTLANLVWMRDVTEHALVIEGLRTALQKKEEHAARLEGILNCLPMPVWVRGEDLSLLHVNAAYAKAVTADSPETVVARQIELTSETMLREARALAASARASHEARSKSFRLVLDGQRCSATLTEEPLSANGALLTAGYVLDQTSVEELRSNLDRHVAGHSEVLEGLSTAIAIFSAEMRLIFFNTAVLRLWDIDPEWLGTQPTFSTILDHLRERRLLPEVADYTAYKERELKLFVSLIVPLETLIHLPDNRTLRRVVRPHPNGGLIYTLEDVTDTLALERSFNVAMAVQRATLDHLHEGVAVFGGDGRLKLTNPAFAHLWKLAPEDLVNGQHLHDMANRLRPLFLSYTSRTKIRPTSFEHLLSLVDERRPMAGRLELQNGRALDCTTVPLPDGAMLLTWLDVTDTVSVERALAERNEALTAADIMKQEFIANLSAEVCTPLTALVFRAEMLSAGYFGTLSSQQVTCVQGIIEIGRSLEGLLSDIIDLAAIGAGQKTLELDTVDLCSMLKSVMVLVRERAAEKKITLELDCPPDIGWIVADTRRIRHGMLSLLGNALKLATPGSIVTIGGERRHAEAILHVSDDRPQRDEQEEDIRLSFPLVQRVVQLHEGRVEVSRTEQGRTITVVRLPVIDEGSRVSDPCGGVGGSAPDQA